MAEEAIKEVMASTHASAESKSEYCPINTSEIIDGNSVPSYLKRKEKPIPHYRRASTGSCHDNCKFGTWRSPESKKFWPVCDWRRDRANARNGKQERAEIIPQGGKRRNKDQTLKISLVKDGSAPAKPELTKSKPLLELKGAPDHFESSPCVELSDEASEPVVAGNQQSDAKCHIISDDDVSNCGDGESAEGAVSIELEMPLAIQDSDESDDHIVDVILPSEDVCEAGEQSPVDHVSYHSANERVSSEKRTNRTVMASEKHEQDKHVTKSESFSKESVKPKAKATLTITRNTMSSKKNGIASHRKVAGTEVESSNGQKTTRKQANVSAPNKFNREKQFNSIVASAFPKVKKMKVPSPASAKDSSARPTTLSKLKQFNSIVASTFPKSASISSSTATQSPRKLTFRRGKVLNLHSNSENNTLRELRFRPAKSADGSSRSQESTRARITRNSDTADSDASKHSGVSRAEVVVLRRQDVKDRKKNEQVLFNNVIEETASKLVEARKSKVKALVGAFETVISLQEKQASPAPCAFPDLKRVVIFGTCEIHVNVGSPQFACF